MSLYDVLLVGGGLQNGLLALALAERGKCRVGLVERSPRLGGNHTWCFHSDDVPAPDASWVEPLIVQRWPGYSVRFPELRREVSDPYAAVTSDRFHDVVSELAARGNLELYLGESVSEVSPGRVVLASGRELRANLVVDARGPEGFPAENVDGYQKFLGHELELDEDYTALPTLMDARVPQRDGFRFFYALPLGPRRILLEDTYFSDSPALDRSQLRLAIHNYANELGLSVARVAREEAGVLPLPTRRVPAFTASAGLIQGGYRGGWFHPTTGYSFPLAVRLASALSSSPPGELHARLERLGRERLRQQRFCVLLNRMLFDGFSADERFRVLERFYRLPAPTLRRFYSLSLTHGDRLRILCGRPPAGFSVRRLFSRRERTATPPQGENV